MVDNGALVRWPHAVVGALASWAWIDVFTARIPGWPEAGAFFVAFVLMQWAIFDLRAAGFVRSIWHGPRDVNKVALTFDDGPDPQTTPKVLATLDLYGVKATFFVLGKKAAAHPGLLRRMREAGHQIECHGQTHRYRNLLTVRRVTRDLQQARDNICMATGECPRYFRPAFGISTPPLATAVRRLGVAVVGWSIRGRDGGGVGDPQRKTAVVLKQARGGDIILLHDAPASTGGREPHGPTMLEAILKGLRDKNLVPVTLDELLASSRREGGSSDEVVATSSTGSQADRRL